ncbi:MAG: hypothetical protein Q7K28_02245 [Candidatus Wildermuthbacteria bacterium]|nr:hypothetical protein [Candidatus Wildermuthbacteria bacterium]
MDFLHKLQNLSEGKRRIILWVALIVLAGVLLFFYGRNIQYKLKNLKMQDFKNQLNFPALKEEFKKIPKIELPKLNGGK